MSGRLRLHKCACRLQISGQGPGYTACGSFRTQKNGRPHFRYLQKGPKTGVEGLRSHCASSWGFRVWGCQARVKGLGSKVWGSASHRLRRGRVWALGFRLWLAYPQAWQGSVG